MKKTCITLGLIVAFLLVSGAIFYAIYSNLSKTLSDTKTNSPDVSSKEEPISSTISTEEYYKEELLLDESEENILLEEETAIEDTSENAEESTGSAESTTSAPSSPVTPTHPYYIKVNRQANCITVYTLDANGAYTVPIKAMVCSVGLNDGTPVGIFKTSTKYLWRALYGNSYGQYAYRINGPILFHSVPYYAQDKGTLKNEEYNKLGQAASLGCIRLSVSDAKWLIDNCPQGTTVEIYDSADPGPLGKPSAIWIDPSSPFRGWDPTDPDPFNPWQTVGPTIIGVSDRTVERGHDLNLLENVYAVDYAGNALPVYTNTTIDTNVCGDYHITYTATDANGRSASQNAIIRVVDTTSPTLSLIGDIIINDSHATQITTAILTKLSAQDGTEKLPTSYTTLNLKALENAMNKKAYGTYTCSGIATDVAGNVSEELIFHVLYVDTPPIISLPATPPTIYITVDSSVPAEAVITQAKQEALAQIATLTTATDSKDGILVPSFQVQSVSTDANGLPNAITLSIHAQDSAGNISTTEYTITILVTVTTVSDPILP